MKTPVYFDDSLAAFLMLGESQLGSSVIDSSIFLRDASGKLTLVVPKDALGEKQREAFGVSAKKELGAYVDDAEHVTATAEELFEEASDLQSQARFVSTGKRRVRLIDRRAVGADWLQEPSSVTAQPPRLVFASLKGGVGRSTALCVLAAHLASSGRRVLAVDMDLEAPGLGNLLLDADTLPEFGLLDFLVEHGLGNVGPEFYVDMIGPSWLGGGRGRVDVIPAIGRKSIANPENVLAKISRAYLSGTGFEPASNFTGHMLELLNEVAEPSRYDVVLIDARAGLHETTGSAVIGLGADVFLFGTNQPQTITGFKLIFAHLSTLPNREDWRGRLRVVHAKLQPTESAEFQGQIASLFEDYLGDKEDAFVPDLGQLKDTFDVIWDEAISDSQIDVEALEVPAPVAIVEDEKFRIFDPVKNRDYLDARFYEAAFVDFLAVATKLVDDALAGSGA